MNVTLRLKSAPTLRLRYQPGLRGPTGLTGSTGPTGPANTLTIGTVTALDYGEPATASVTGTAPNQVLNLGLPAGEQGPSGSVTDGDKGDIVVSSAGTVWTVDNGAISYAKLAAVAEDRSQAGFKITDVGDATDDTDALNRQTADLRYNVGARLRQITVYTASATWTKQVWTKAVRVTVAGGGASGGSPQSSTGNMAIAGGGGAGGVSIRFILAAALDASETVTVGAGGAGPSAPSAGNAGGTSSFGALASATGGAGGDSDLAGSTSAGQRVGGAGGIGSGGDINIAGAPGGTGIRFNGTVGHSGVGGSGPYGGGGRSVTQGSSGVNGRGYGAGGSGGASNDSTGRLGGNGVGGLVIVEEFE